MHFLEIIILGGYFVSTGLKKVFFIDKLSDIQVNLPHWGGLKIGMLINMESTVMSIVDSVLLDR